MTESERTRRDAYRLVVCHHGRRVVLGPVLAERKRATAQVAPTVLQHAHRDSVVGILLQRCASPHAPNNAAASGSDWVTIESWDERVVRRILAQATAASAKVSQVKAGRGGARVDGRPDYRPRASHRWALLATVALAVVTWCGLVMILGEGAWPAWSVRARASQPAVATELPFEAPARSHSAARSPAENLDGAVNTAAAPSVPDSGR